jgi:cytochrome o ubiquinol oxidase subunit 3
MSEIIQNQLTENHSHHQDKTILGFWIYLMTDLMMFAALFAAFIVLRGNTFGGLGPAELFSLPLALKETLILLTSSFTCGLAMISAHKNNKKQTLFWFFVTFILGAWFIFLELTEFYNLIAEGHSFQTNSFLSSFFALVATHGLHIAVGLLWILISAVMIWRRGLTPFVNSKLTRLSMFWHFLDLVWIFIFTVVYLLSKT